MALGNKLDDLRMIAEASAGFRNSMVANREQQQKLDQMAQMRALAEQAPDLLQQRNGFQQYAAQAAQAGQPELLNQLFMGQGKYAQEQAQGLSPEQFSQFGLSQEQVAPFQGATLEQQKLLLDQQNKKDEMNAKIKELAIKNAEKKLAEKKISQDQGKSAGFYLRTKNGNEGLNAFVQKNPDFFSRYSREQIIKAFNAPESIKSEDLKTFIVHFRSFITPQLRDETGATIQPSEYDASSQEFIPANGDTPEVMNLKLRNRTNYIGALRSRAGDDAVNRAEKYAEQEYNKSLEFIKKQKYKAISKKISGIKNTALRKEADALMQEAIASGQEIDQDLIKELEALVIEGSK